MSNQTLSVINKATKIKEKYDILTFDTHERYQTQLCKTGHNFYSFRYADCKKWDESYAVRPTNYFILPENSIFSGIDFDFILSQSKFGQIQTAQQINRYLGLPIVSLEHTLPLPHWPDGQLEMFKRLTGDINVFISEYSVGRWGIFGNSEVIHHSVDIDVFSPGLERDKEHVVLSVVNEFATRDYCCNYSGWKRITDGIPVKLVGNNPGLSEPASSIGELANEYRNAAVFLNTSTISPVPTSLLEAMACGCAVVSTATCMIPNIIQSGVNGFMSNDESELRGMIEILLNDEKLREDFGKAARQTIKDNFSESKFINNWNNVFDTAYRIKK